MKSEEFVSDLIDLLIKKVIKVEPPAPTPKATNDEIPLFEEICKNFGLNDVDLDYSDADYQNLTTYKMFQQAYRSRIQSANPKVSYFCLPVDIESFWTEGYAGQILNSGHELAIYVL